MKKLTLHHEGQEALGAVESYEIKPGTCKKGDHVLLCLRGDCVQDREYHEYVATVVLPVDRHGGRELVTFCKASKNRSLAVPSAKAMPMANDATVAEQFRAQLGRVAEAEQNSLKQRVILGAMLIKWERFLGDGRGHGEGEGLKGWLDKNLPELPYVRAHGYKQMATKFLDMMGGGAMALEAMAGGETVTDPAGETVAIEAEIIEKRDEIFAAADSRRKLEQMWFDFSGEPKKKGKAGRPKGSKAQYQGYQGEALQPAQAARALWSKVMEPAMDAGLGAAAKLLGEKDVADALAVLEPLVSILKQRKSEF